MGTLTSFAYCLLLSSVSAERWRWPSEADTVGAESVRIDTNVRFVDDAVHRDPRDKSVKNPNHYEHESPDSPFKEPTETEGFYNRPPGAGRYPVRVEAHKSPYSVDQRAVYPVYSKDQRQAIEPHVSDGTLDSFQYCQCISTPDCNPRYDSEKACGPGKYLCCYKRPNKVSTSNAEYFNEVDDVERPMLYPGQENIGGPFPPPNPDGAALFDHARYPNRDADGLHVGPVGPGGPTGHLGAPKRPNVSTLQRPILVGPNGPTGQLGPPKRPNVSTPQLPVFDGANGSTGPVEGPKADYGSESAQRGVLVGPGGPTGMIGPYQRPVLVGPGGPTGVIGPGGRGGRRGILSGPGGPTGVIGPYRGQGGRGVLVGPGGPTGTIGPGRGLLVGPGGPTGNIGPQRYYDCDRKKKKISSKDNTNITSLELATDKMGHVVTDKLGHAVTNEMGHVITEKTILKFLRVERSADTIPIKLKKVDDSIKESLSNEAKKQLNKEIKSLKTSRVKREWRRRTKRPRKKTTTTSKKPARKSLSYGGRPYGERVYAARIDREMEEERQRYIKRRDERRRIMKQRREARREAARKHAEAVARRQNMFPPGLGAVVALLFTT